MDWVSRAIEQRLAEAAANGELDGGPLKGKPLPGIDEQRPDGWWAQRFVQRELSHDRRKVAVEAAARARAQFWRAANSAELDERIDAANAAIATANVNLVAEDLIEPFDRSAVHATWAELRA